MFKVYVILFFVLFNLVGCATTDTTTVVRIKNNLILPPDELIQKCNTEAPPERELYISSSWSMKEELLINHSKMQYKNIQKCNTVIDSLFDWKKKMLELYKDVKE